MIKEKPLSKSEMRNSVKNLINYIIQVVKYLDMFNDKLSGLDEVIRSFLVDMEFYVVFNLVYVVFILYILIFVIY
jgi:hypothetical protein